MYLHIIYQLWIFRGYSKINYYELSMNHAIDKDVFITINYLGQITTISITHRINILQKIIMITKVII